MRTIFTFAFLAAIFGFAVSLALGLGDPKGRTLSEKFPLKEQFIEFNGGASRLAGRRFVNTVYRTPRGMLLSEQPRHPRSIESAPSLLADRVDEFRHWLEKRGVAYIYMQAPAKIDMKGLMLPSEFRHDGNLMADRFLAELAKRGVRVMDVRETLTATEDDVMRYFYMTDHHWNNDAAFRAFVEVAPELAALAGADPAAAKRVASRRAWKRKIWENCFMGSKSRRTGRLFGGIDDLAVYTPKFKTKMTIEIPSRKLKRTGSFRETVMWDSDRILAMRGDEFKADAYSHLYIGGLFGVVRFKNRKAPVEKRLVVVGDSYSRPLQGLLSTVFSEILALDQRRFKPGETVAGFVEEFKPAVVLQLDNPGALGLGGGDASGPSGFKSSAVFDYGELR